MPFTKLKPFLTIAFLLGCGALVGQTFEEHRSTWVPNYQIVPLPSINLRIDLPGDATWSDWAMSVEPSAGPAARVAVGDIVFSPPRPAPTGRIISAMGDLPKESVAINPGAIRILTSPAPGHLAIVHVKAPPNTSIVVLLGTKSLITQNVGPGFVLRNGLVTHHSSMSLGPLVQFGANGSQLTSPSQGESDDRVIRKRDGSLVVGVSGLVKHALSLPPPKCSDDFATGVPAGASRSVVLVKVSISASGEVVAATRTDSPLPLSRLCELTIRSWRFAPFLLDGTPAAVFASVPLQLGQDGVVRSPLGLR